MVKTCTAALNEFSMSLVSFMALLALSPFLIIIYYILGLTGEGEFFTASKE